MLVFVLLPINVSLFFNRSQGAGFAPLESFRESVAFRRNDATFTPISYLYADNFLFYLSLFICYIYTQIYIYIYIQIVILCVLGEDGLRAAFLG